MDPRLEYNMMEGYRLRHPLDTMRDCMHMSGEEQPERGGRRRGAPAAHEGQRFFGLTTDRVNTLTRTEPVEDATVSEILNPELRALYGLNEDDLLKPRSKDEVRDLFETMGLRYKLAKLEGAWSRARSMEPEASGPARASLDSILRAFREMHYVN